MKAVREVVEGSIEAGIEILTLFAFSQENWTRPAGEVSALMQLLAKYVAKETACSPTAMPSPAGPAMPCAPL